MAMPQVRDRRRGSRSLPLRLGADRPAL